MITIALAMHETQAHYTSKETKNCNIMWNDDWRIQFQVHKYIRWSGAFVFLKFTVTTETWSEKGKKFTAMKQWTDAERRMSRMLNSSNAAGNAAPCRLETAGFKWKLSRVAVHILWKTSSLLCRKNITILIIIRNEAKDKTQEKLNWTEILTHY